MYVVIVVGGVVVDDVFVIGLFDLVGFEWFDYVVLFGYLVDLVVIFDVYVGVLKGKG